MVAIKNLIRQDNVVKKHNVTKVMSRAEMGRTSGRISLKPLYLDTLKKLNLHYGVFCVRNKFTSLDHILIGMEIRIPGR